MNLQLSFLRSAALASALGCCLAAPALAGPYLAGTASAGYSKLVAQSTAAPPKIVQFTASGTLGWFVNDHVLLAGTSRYEWLNQSGDPSSGNATGTRAEGIMPTFG